MKSWLKRREKSKVSRLQLIVFVLLLGLVTVSGVPATVAGELDLSISFDNPVLKSGHPESRSLEILVRASEERSSGRNHLRRPLNLALVIDRSGSMAQEQKLENVKQAAISMLQRLKPGDYFSLVSYDTNIQVHIPSEPVEGLHRAKSLIRGLRPGGSTNLGGGLEEGYRQVRRHFSSTSINRVLLLSDGLANVGIQSPRRLSSIALREAEYGISLSTFGVGIQFNEDLLAALSESGRGMYYFIDEPAQIHDILAQEFRNVEQVVARDIRFTVSLQHDMEIDQVFANSYQIEENRIYIQVGDLSAGELRRLQIRFFPSQLSAGHHEIGDVEMDYQPADQAERRVSSQAVMLVSSPDASFVERSRNQDVSDRAYVFEAHYARSRAAQAVDRNDLMEADRILRGVQKYLEAAPVQSKRVAEELSAVKTYAEALRQPLTRKQRARVQKRVKYKSYTLEGC